MASNVLVTGDSGLIGSKLKSSHNVNYNKLNPRIDLLQKNSEKKLLDYAEANNFDTILHLAWSSNSQRNYESDYVNSNWAEKTIKIAELAVNRGISLLVTGSGSQDDLENRTAYIESKRLVASSQSTNILNQKLTFIKIFWVVDIALRRPRIITELFNRDIPFILEFGNTKNDYIFSDDVASGIHTIITYKLRGEIELGSGFLTPNEQLIKYVCHEYSLPIPEILNVYKKNGKTAEISKLTNLGWHPIQTIKRLGVK